ncbi:MAG: tail fiber domain-containing protein [Moraxellaceae bacterium]|nr:tail fiber domain-containing protein [Moraxellaceae bacterium]
MSECNNNIADKLLVGTKLGVDCNGNDLGAGQAIATCKDLQQAKQDIIETTEDKISKIPIPKTCDGGKVTNETKLVTCADYEEVKDTANTALDKAKQALEQNQDDIVDVTAGENGRVIATMRDGTTKDITIDTDQARLAIEGTNLVLYNENGKKSTLSKSQLIKLLGVQQPTLAKTGIKSFNIKGDKLAITANDGSTDSISKAELIKFLNNGMATDKELAQAIAGIKHPTTLVKAGTNTTVNKTVSGNTTTYTINANGGSANNIQFANEREINEGGNANANKAVSAKEYADEIHITHDLIDIGRVRKHAQEKRTELPKKTSTNNGGISIVTNNGRVHHGILRLAESIYINTRGRNNRGDLTLTDSILINAPHTNTSTLDNVVCINTDTNQLASNENCVAIGNYRITHTQLQGEVHGQSFINQSDQRLKNKLQLLNTLPNGIEVWKYQYINNGNIQIGWIAQQVEELLHAKGYDDDIITLAIPRLHDIDWHATIANFNGKTNNNISLWTQAKQALANYKLAKARKLNVTENTLEEFIAHIETIPEDERNQWQQSTYKTLQAIQLENYYIYADDIRSIDKNAVNDLLS